MKVTLAQTGARVTQCALRCRETLKSVCGKLSDCNCERSEQPLPKGGPGRPNKCKQFPDFSRVERTPRCVPYNSVCFVQITLRLLIYIAVRTLSIYMPKELGK